MTRLVGLNIKNTIERVARNNATRLVEELTQEDLFPDMAVFWSIDVFIPKGIMPIEVRSAVLPLLRTQIDNHDYRTESIESSGYKIRAWDKMVDSLLNNKSVYGEDVSITLSMGSLRIVMKTIEELMGTVHDEMSVMMANRRYVPFESLAEYNALQRVFKSLHDIYGEALHSASNDVQTQEVEPTKQ